MTDKTTDNEMTHAEISERNRTDETHSTFHDLSQQPANEWQKERLRNLGRQDDWIDQDIHSMQEASEAINRLRAEQPIQTCQREDLHDLGKIDTWIDEHLHNYEEADTAISALQKAEHAAAQARRQTKPDPQAGDIIDLSYVRPDFALQFKREDDDDDDPWKTSAHLIYDPDEPWTCRWSFPDFYREERIEKYQRQDLHELGKTDAWIAAHVHDKLEAAAVISELERATEWDVEKAGWLFAEMPEAVVESDLVAQVTSTLRLMQRLLRLPPLRVRWYDELGLLGAVPRKTWKALSRQWGCDSPTVRKEHLAHFVYRTRYDGHQRRIVRISTDRHPYSRARNGEQGVLTYTGEPLGWVEASAPDIINLRSDEGLFFTYNRAPYSALVSDLDPRYEGWPNYGLENWIQAVVIRECRRLWQLRHWSPAMLEDRNYAEQDAYDYMRWFTYFARGQSGACDARRVPFTMEQVVEEIPDHVG